MTEPTALSKDWWPDQWSFALAESQFSGIDLIQHTSQWRSLMVATGERHLSWLNAWRTSIRDSARENRHVKDRSAHEGTDKVKLDTQLERSSLPPDWAPPAELAASLNRRFPTLDFKTELDRFHTYYAPKNKDRLGNWEYVWKRWIETHAARVGAIDRQSAYVPTGWWPEQDLIEAAAMLCPEIDVTDLTRQFVSENENRTLVLHGGRLITPVQGWLIFLRSRRTEEIEKADHAVE